MPGGFRVPEQGRLARELGARLRRAFAGTLVSVARLDVSHDNNLSGAYAISMTPAVFGRGALGLHGYTSLEVLLEFGRSSAKLSVHWYKPSLGNHRLGRWTLPSHHELPALAAAIDSSWDDLVEAVAKGLGEVKQWTRWDMDFHWSGWVKIFALGASVVAMTFPWLSRHLPL